MHYYEFHISDYLSKTAHLSRDEDLAYRRLLDLYYDTEQPLPNDMGLVSRRIRMPDLCEIVFAILSEFFTLEPDGLWHHHICDTKINRFKQQKESGRAAAVKRWSNNNNELDTPPIGLALGTVYQPITNNQQPITNKDNTPLSPPLAGEINPMVKAVRLKGSRLAENWALPEEWGQWAEGRGLSYDQVILEEDKFRNYWHAKAGQGAAKLDWFATWRNWIFSAAERQASKPTQPRKDY